MGSLKSNRVLYSFYFISGENCEKMNQSLQVQLVSHILFNTAGMLLMGFTLRNIPVITDSVYINTKWSASLRNIALAVILARAGLGLDPLVCLLFY